MEKTTSGQISGGKPLTGRKVFAITFAFFAIIIAVNVYMATKAIRTFPGLEVDNSYVASQVFDKELAAQRALGWQLTHRYENGNLVLSFCDRDGRPVRVERLSALLGRTTEAAEDRRPDFARVGDDYVAAANLTKGKWMILVEAFDSAGTRFHQRLDLLVRG